MTCNEVVELDLCEECPWACDEVCEPGTPAGDGCPVLAARARRDREIAEAT